MMGALIDVTGPAEGEFLEALLERRDGMVVVRPATSTTWHRELLRLLADPASETWRVPAIAGLLKLLLIDLLEAMVDLDPWRPGSDADEASSDARSRDLCRHHGHSRCRICWSSRRPLARV